MLEYNIMQQTKKQILAQYILSHHKALHIQKLTLMYTLREAACTLAKPSIIVSVSKKITPKATARNYIKRVLRATLRQTLSPSVFSTFDWLWICKEPELKTDLRKEIVASLQQFAP